MYNRGFRYGDGFFETIRITKGYAPLAEYHLNRIKDAMQILQLESENDLDLDWLHGLIRAEEHPNHLMRAYIYRMGEGKYAPINNLCEIETEHLETSLGFWLPEKLNLQEELKLAPEQMGAFKVFPDAKPNHPLFTVKSLSSAYYVLAAKFGAEEQVKYVLLQDQAGNLLEEVTSNLILLRNNELFTPKIGLGGVYGATMRYLIQQYGFQLNQVEIKANDIEKYEAVYSCKASTGISRIA